MLLNCDLPKGKSPVIDFGVDSKVPASTVTLIVASLQWSIVSFFELMAHVLILSFILLWIVSNEEFLNIIETLYVVLMPSRISGSVQATVVIELTVANERLDTGFNSSIIYFNMEVYS